MKRFIVTKICNIQDRLSNMIKVILNEDTLTAMDHRGATVVKVSMPIQSSSVIYVRKYRKSFRITLGNIVIWNVACCVWAGDEKNVPQIMKEEKQAESSETSSDKFKLLYLPR